MGDLKRPKTVAAPSFDQKQNSGLRDVIRPRILR